MMVGGALGGEDNWERGKAKFLYSGTLSCKVRYDRWWCPSLLSLPKYREINLLPIPKWTSYVGFAVFNGLDKGSFKRRALSRAGKSHSY